MGWNASLPFIGIYLAVDRGTPLWIVGLSYLGTGIISLGSQILGGRLTDRYGPRRVMLLGYALSIVSAFVLGYLVSSTADPLIVATLYPISALTRGLCQPVPAAIIASAKPTNMMTQFSFLTIAANLSFAIGPAIGGVLAQYYGYPVVFYFTAAVFGAATVAAFISIGGGLLYDSAFPREGRKWRLDWTRDRSTIILLILAFCSFLVSGFDIQPLSLYSAEFLRIPNDEIGYLFSANGLGIVLLQLPIIKMIQRLKFVLLPLIMANIVCIIGFILATFVTTFAGLLIVMVILTLSEMLLAVPMQSIMAVLSKPATRGAYQGLSSAVMNGGRSMSAFVGPSLLSLFIFSPKLSWYAISGVAVVAALGLVLLSPRLQTDYDKARSDRGEQATLRIWTTPPHLAQDPIASAS